MSDVVYTCAWCGSQPALFRCTACGRVRYCNNSCQRQHWSKASAAAVDMLVVDADVAGASAQPHPSLPHKQWCKTRTTIEKSESAASPSPSPKASALFSDDFPILPTIDDFALSATGLGDGNYSRVLKGRLRKTGKTYAIKVVEKAKVKRIALRHPNVQREVMQEKHVGLLLSQGEVRVDDMTSEQKDLIMKGRDRITKLHCTFQDEASLYYVYEYVGCGEVWQMLMEPCGLVSLNPQIPTPMFIDDAAWITADTITALAYMHAMGIAHRDLKPENMMLEDCGGMKRVKLIDFATAKDLLCAKFNSGSDFVGTPDYMPPEAISATHHGAALQPVDSRGDLWALGSVVYHLLAGVTPFKTASQYLTMEKILASNITHDEKRSDKESAAERDVIKDFGGVDGLLYPALFPASAEQFIEALLVKQAAHRLGVVESAADSGAGLKAGVCRVISGDDDTPAPLAATTTSRKTAAAAGKDPRELLPKQLPCINYHTLLQHPFLAAQLSKTDLKDSTETTFTLDSAVAALKEDAGVSLKHTHDAIKWIARYLASLDKPSRDETEDLVCEKFSVLTEQQIMLLLHLLALRRRIHVPKILTQLLRSHSSLCRGVGELRCLRMLGWNSLKNNFLRLGEYSPREILGWNLSPSMYASEHELAEHARAFHGVKTVSELLENPETKMKADRANDFGWRAIHGAEFYANHQVIVISNIRMRDDEHVKSTVKSLFEGINALSLKPRAIIVLGTLTHDFNADTGSPNTSWDTVASQTSLFAQACEGLSHEISVITQSIERIDSIAALRCAEAHGTQLSNVRNLSTHVHSCAAWIHGVRWVFTTSSVCEELRNSPIADDETTPDLHKAVESFRAGLSTDARWLHECLEHARVGALHTIIALYDENPISDETRKRIAALSGARAILQPSAASAERKADYTDPIVCDATVRVHVPSLFDDNNACIISVTQHDVTARLSRIA